MSLKQRGQEVTIQVARDGVLVGGTMTKITDFTATPRTELKEDDYLGEPETDLDQQHHGWDMSWSVDVIDQAILDMTDDMIQRERDHLRPRDVTVTVIHVYREPGAQNRIEVYHSVFMKTDDEGFGGRKEKVKSKISAKCKVRSLMKG